MPQRTQSSSRLTKRWIFIAVSGLIVATIVLTALYLIKDKVIIQRTAHLVVHDADILERNVHVSVADAIEIRNYPAVGGDFGTFSQNKLRSGAGSAIVVRSKISKSSSPYVNDYDYEYITIILPNYNTDGGEYFAGSPSEPEKFFAIYAVGSVHYPDNACFGYAFKGYVRVEPASEGFVQISVSLLFDGVRMFGDRLRSCGEKRIYLKDKFREISLLEFQKSKFSKFWENDDNSDWWARTWSLDF